MPQDCGRPPRLEHPGHVRARLREPRRHRQQERPRPGDHDPAARDHALALEERLHAARGEHTGERPAGEGELAVVGAGREDHRPGMDLATGRLAAVVGHVRGEPLGRPLQVPDRVFREVGERTRQPQRLERGPQGHEGVPVVVAGTRVVRTVAPVLAARPHARIEQGDPDAGGQADACRGSRRRQPGRPGPDHQDVERVRGQVGMACPLLGEDAVALVDLGQAGSDTRLPVHVHETVEADPDAAEQAARRPVHACGAP